MSGQHSAMAVRKHPLRVWRPALAAAIGAFAMDQATKWVIVSMVMNPPRLVSVLPFFDLTLGFNRGVSFGMLSGAFGDSPWILIGISFVVIALLLPFLVSARGPLEAVSVGAIIGGALGNVLDRMRLGAVVDFLDLHAAGWHWPAFNMADAAITLGVAVLMLSGLRNVSRTATHVSS